MFEFLKKFLASSNESEIKRLKKTVDKINGLDAAQLEATIFGIMKHELKAIVWLGALLGSLMGFVNLLL